MMPWIPPVLVGAVGVAIARIVGIKLSPALEWPLLLLVFAAVCALCVRMRAQRAHRTERIVAAVRALADGRELDVGKLAADDMDDELLAAFRDLDRAVALLRQDKSRAEKVLSEITDGIITVNGDGEVTLFNRAAESMFDARSLRSRSDRVDAAEFHPEIAQIAADCIAGKSVLSTEVRLPGVPEKVIGIRAAPFSRSQQGDIALLLLHDLSEIRRHEKMQKTFVSNVSHELRTPITAVRATAEALIAGARNDEELVDRFLNAILNESDRLSALIDDLMDIAKRESGVTRTEKGNLSVAEVVKLAFTTVRPLARQKQVEVEFVVPEGLLVLGDEIQLVQLVRNLLDNAVKYTPEGGGSMSRPRVPATRSRSPFATPVSASLTEKWIVYSTGSTAWTRHGRAGSVEPGWVWR